MHVILTSSISFGRDKESRLNQPKKKKKTVESYNTLNLLFRLQKHIFKLYLRFL